MQVILYLPHQAGVRIRSGNMLCCAKSLQSCLTLSDRMDCSLLGSSVHGILQARILEWIAMPSSRGSSWARDWTWVSYMGREMDSLSLSHQESLSQILGLNPHWRKSNRSLPVLGESSQKTLGFLPPARTCRQLTYTGGQWPVPHSPVSTQTGQSAPAVHSVARVTAV